MAGNDEAKRARDDTHLRQGKLLADHLQHEIDARVEDEEILYLATGPRESLFQPVGVRLMEECDTAQRDQREAYAERVEVARIGSHTHSLEHLPDHQEHG